VSLIRSSWHYVILVLIIIYTNTYLCTWFIPLICAPPTISFSPVASHFLQSHMNAGYLSIHQRFLFTITYILEDRSKYISCPTWSPTPWYWLPRIWRCYFRALRDGHVCEAKGPITLMNINLVLVLIPESFARDASDQMSAWYTVWEANWQFLPNQALSSPYA